MNEKLHESFHRVARLMRRERMNGRGNMPNARNRAVSVLALNDGLSQSQLAYILGIRPQSAGELVKKMESLGLVEKQVDESDNRVNKIYLTDLGKEQAKVNEQSTEVKDIFECLSEEKQEELQALLDEVLNYHGFDKEDPRAFRAPFDPRRAYLHEDMRRPGHRCRRMPQNDEEVPFDGPRMGRGKRTEASFMPHLEAHFEDDEEDGQFEPEESEI